MRLLKVGLLGAGRIASLVHLKALRRVRGVRVTSVAEPDKARLAAVLARCPGAQGFADYRDLLSGAEIDAVVVCLPNALHASAALEAFRQGKHVYMEKPLALTCAEALPVLAAWRHAGTVGMMGYNLRFNPLYADARRRIRAGQLGAATSGFTRFLSGEDPFPDWKKSSPGGVLLDLGLHHIDLAQHIFGCPVERVAAELHSRLHPNDTAATRFWLKDGPVVDSYFSYSEVPEDTFEVVGSRLTLKLERYGGWGVDVWKTGSEAGSRTTRAWRRVSRVWRAPNKLDRLLAPGRERSYETALRRFAQAAAKGAPVSPDLEDGYRTLAVAEAALESAVKGAPCAVKREVPA